MSYVALMAKVPMFARLEAADLDRLSGLLQPRRYAEDEVIFHEGDVGTALYLIRKGEVAIRLSSSDGKEVTLALLGRGETFGELSLLDGEPRSADAVAREETHLLILQREDFLRFAVERPAVTMALFSSLSHLVRRLTQQVHDAAFLDVRGRLVRVLLQLARTQGEEGPKGVVITSKLTQGDLAALCRATRESTNRWLRFYEREGLLEHRSGRLTLLDVERLRRDLG